MNLFSRGFGGETVQVFRVGAASHNMDSAEGSACHFLQFPGCPSVTLGQAGVDHRGNLPQSLRNRLSAVGTGLLHFLRHTLRGQETLIVGVHPGREIPVFLRHLTDLGKGIPVLKFMAHRLNHPQSHDVLQITEPVAVAALVSEISSAAFLGAVRLHPLDSHQRPGSGADIDEIVIIGRHRQHRGTGVMGGRHHHIQVKAHLFFHRFRQAAQVCPRRHQFLKHFPVIAQPPDQLLVPVLCHRAHQLAGGGLRILVHLFPGEKIMEIIRHEQQTVRRLHILRMLLLHRHQLVNGVENGFLNPRPGIQLFGRYLLIYLFVHADIAPVPVAHGVAQHLSFFVQQDEIHAPGVHAHAHRDFPQLLTFFHAGKNLRKKPVRLPAELTVLFYHAVGETVNFLQPHPAVFHPPQDMSSAGSADIHCQIIRCHDTPPPV